jgi:alanyl-tRNA synthetase
MTSAEIRRQYIDYFVTRCGHTFVPSSPVVPLDDPTLLFTNAGMNQFKPLFLGQEKRSYTRAVNSQKCIRAGGKHNDLEDVGRSRRHHTFFEMLGNWSFGDYFKAEAIEWAWDLLTNVWKLDPDRLHVTCYEGDEANGVPRDTECAELWHKITGLPASRIHYFGKDNFWEMGDTGPCGPCTEIHIDRTPDKTGGQDVNGDDPRVMEIWNLVFIQYNRNPDRSLTPLPARHVDTGMGFERICQIIQGVDSNYGIDLWQPYFQRLSELTGRRYEGRFPATNAPDPAAEAADPQLRTDIAFRVIADHLRMATFAICDGAQPGNKGRDSVLRSVIRRAVRFGYQQLDLRSPFLHGLVPVVADSMGEIFPEVRARSRAVSETLLAEEESFFRTLERGIHLFEEAAERGRADRTISAGDAFHLHTTFGFPPDMTKQMAAERGLGVDLPGYEQLFAKFQEESGKRPSAAGLGAVDMKGLPGTDDSAKYGSSPIQARVLAAGLGSPMKFEASPGHVFEAGSHLVLLLDRTNFYAEQGGQVGDSGRIRGPKGVFRVATTLRSGDYVLHEGIVEAGTLSVGDEVRLEIDPSRRSTEQNHTATHVLNWALREVLGDDVQQKGSLVDPEKLRFDFSHGSPLATDELMRVQSLVDAQISAGHAVYAQDAPQEMALKIRGLRAVFGEKYPPMVRVVSLGVPVNELLKNPTDERWRGYSIEFCGGTHVQNTREIGAFVVVGEEGVSKGVRRVVCLTGDRAVRAQRAGESLLDRLREAKLLEPSALAGLISALQKESSSSDIPAVVRRDVQAGIVELQTRVKQWEKSARPSVKLDVSEVAEKLLAGGWSCGSEKVVVGDVPGADEEALRSVLDSLRKRSPGCAALVGAVVGERVQFAAAVSEELIRRGLKAGDWVREAAKTAGGSGGGRPQMALAGGKDPAKLGEALEAAEAYARRLLS